MGRKKKNLPLKMFSIALIVTGVCLAGWGYQLSGSVSSQITKALSGSYTDKIMTLYICGAVCFIVGLFLNIRK